MNTCERCLREIPPHLVHEPRRGGCVWYDRRYREQRGRGSLNILKWMTRREK